MTGIDVLKRSRLAWPAMLLYLLLTAVSPGHASMPLGIPAPAFGMDESHWQYQGQSGYRDAGNGPYTHYVDNRASACSDSGPGTAQQPLCRLPLSVPAGSVVEVHGGPYGQAEYARNKRKLTLRGTASKPVFVRGVADHRGEYPLFRDTTFAAYGQYFVLENLVLDGTNIHVGIGDHVDHVALRNMEVRNHPENNAVNLYGTDMLLLDSHIHHNYGDDRHGVYISYRSKHVWVLGNDIHHNSGDGIQFCHKCSSEPPEYVYIGDNDFYSNRENGVDLKYARNVVVSQNRIYQHIDAPRNEYWCFDDDSYCGVFSSGSDGSSIVVGSDGGPENVAIIFNDIFDSANGIRIEEGRNVIVAGNQIHRIAYNGLILEKYGRDISFSNNTLHNMDTGVRQKTGADFAIEIRNNIFSDIGRMFEVREEALAEGIALDNNLFWDGGEPMRFRWLQSSKLFTGADFDALSGAPKQGNRVADPHFLTPHKGDFGVADGSPVLDRAGADMVALSQRFRSLFRNSPAILRDFRGVPREGCDIDIGAYESVCVVGDSSAGGGGVDPGGGEDNAGDGGSGSDDGGGNSGSASGDGGDGGGPGGGGQGESGLPEVLEASRSYNPMLSIDASLAFAGAASVTVTDSIAVTSGFPGDNWLRLYIENASQSMTCLYRGNGARRSTGAPCSRANGDAYLFSHCLEQSFYERYECGKSPDRKKCTGASLNVGAFDSVSAEFVELGILDGDRCGETVVEAGCAANVGGAAPLCMAGSVELPAEDEDDLPVDETDDSAADPGGDSSGGSADDSGSDSGADSGGSGGAVGAPATLEARRAYSPDVRVDASASFKTAQPITLAASLQVIAGNAGDNWARLYLAGGSQSMTCLYKGDGLRRNTSSPCNSENGTSYRFYHCIEQSYYQRYQCGKSPQRGKCTSAALDVYALDTVEANYIELGIVDADRCGEAVIQGNF